MVWKGVTLGGINNQAGFVTFWSSRRIANCQVRLVEGNTYQRSTLHWVNAHTYACLTLVSVTHPLRLPQLCQLGHAMQWKQGLQTAVCLYTAKQTDRRLKWVTEDSKKEDKRQSTVTSDMLILNFPHAQPFVCYLTSTTCTQRFLDTQWESADAPCWMASRYKCRSCVSPTSRPVLHSAFSYQSTSASLRSNKSVHCIFLLIKHLQSKSVFFFVTKWIIWNRQRIVILNPPVWFHVRNCILNGVSIGQNIQEKKKKESRKGRKNKGINRKTCVYILMYS